MTIMLVLSSVSHWTVAFRADSKTIPKCVYQHHPIQPTFGLHSVGVIGLGLGQSSVYLFEWLRPIIMTRSTVLCCLTYLNEFWVLPWAPTTSSRLANPWVSTSPMASDDMSLTVFERPELRSERDCPEGFGVIIGPSFCHYVFPVNIMQQITRYAVLVQTLSQNDSDYQQFYVLQR